jgi:tRNA threonylcarbamoyladenosine biosynthesis protein TsaB
VIVLGFDTATRSTAVGLRLAEGDTLQSRDDPGPDEHPGHATRLLGMTDELLTRAGIGWSALERIAVGLGPGTFTGLRVGVATARGLAQSLEIELVGVSSLRALAAGGAGSGKGGGVAVSGGVAMRGGVAMEEEVDPDMSGLLAVLDARRGEAFAAAYRMTERGLAEELVPARALAPEDLGSIVAQAEAQRGGEHGRLWWAIGDGAIRFRGQLEAAGVAVAPDSSPLHLLSAEAICDLGARAAAVASYEAIVPDYCRRPDAEIALERAGDRPGASARLGGRARSEGCAGSGGVHAREER